MRKRIFFPEMEISDEEYLRAFVGKFLICPGMAAAWPRIPRHKKAEFATRLSQRLGGEELMKVLTDFDREQQEETAKLRGLGYPPRLVNDVGEVAALGKLGRIARELAEKHGLTD